MLLQLDDREWAEKARAVRARAARQNRHDVLERRRFHGVHRQFDVLNQHLEQLAGPPETVLLGNTGGER